MFCSAAGDMANYRKDGSLAVCVCVCVLYNGLLQCTPSLLGIPSKAPIHTKLCCQDRDEGLNTNTSHLSCRPSTSFPFITTIRISLLLCQCLLTTIWKTASHPKSPRHLRSSYNLTSSSPRSKFRTAGDRSFQSAALQSWNGSTGTEVK